MNAKPLAVQEFAKVVMASLDASARILLQNAGFSEIRIVSDLQHAGELIAEDKCDILIAEDVVGERSSAPLIKSIRQGEVGFNPFLPIIAVITINDERSIRRLIETGVDDVLAKPLSSKTLKRRMEALGRRDFHYVVRQDYVGPSRRRERADQGMDRLIDAPNALKIKSAGHPLADYDIQRLVSEAKEVLVERTIRINGLRISEILDEIVSAGDENLTIGLRKLDHFVLDFAKRLKGTDKTSFKELCAVLQRVIGDSLADPNKSNIELLALVARAVDLSFRAEGNQQAQADEIIHLIQQRYAG